MLPDAVKVEGPEVTVAAPSWSAGAHRQDSRKVIGAESETVGVRWQAHLAADQDTGPAATPRAPGANRMKRNLIRIHLIDKTRDVYRMGGFVPGTVVQGVYVTTQWRMSEEAATSCIGAELHLHDAQHLPSFQAGICTGYFPLFDGYGLLFVNDPAMAGCVQEENWGQGQARVYGAEVVLHLRRTPKPIAFFEADESAQ